jgi:hypothetical protein
MGAVRASFSAFNTADTHSFTVTVYDKESGSPLELVRVLIIRDGTLIQVGLTNPTGVTVFRDVPSGQYVLGTRRLGYADYSDTLSIDPSHSSVTVRISEGTIQTQAVEVSGSRFSNVSSMVDIRTGNQVLEGETYHPAPTAQATDLIQENLAGSVRAPTGEVHIRGMHGEYTYFIDGVPIPLGVFGGLNDIIDNRVVDRATFYTGGFPAEYGGQCAAIVDMHTRVPSGRFHLDASSYAGSYLTSDNSSLGDRVGALKSLNSNGQNLSLSNRTGNLGFFVSGTRQETDRRIDQPVENLFHDHGFNYFAYGKLYYIFSENDYMTTNLGYSQTETQVPFDSAEGILFDTQNTHDAFQTFSYFHRIPGDDDQESNLFIGLYAREGGLRYDPSILDDTKQFLEGDTATGYVVAQRRSFTTLGLRVKYDVQLSHQFTYSVGMDYGHSSGSEDFAFLPEAGTGPVFSGDFSGFDVAGFAQVGWHPLEWIAIDAGLRYDQHNSPDIPSQDQMSPRVKVSFFPDVVSTISLYYGRLFIPTNIEGLHRLALQIGGSNSGTLPERDKFYEAVYTRSWPLNLSSKIALFHKDGAPGIDDQTLGSSSVRTPVNLALENITGLELALTYNDPSSPFSGFANAALIHAYARGPVSGAFLAPDSSADIFDNDHDQRLSAVVGVNYQQSGFFVNLRGLYGSGLTNGNGSYAFKTGLFDFNQGAHTDPAWILNCGAGYSIPLGEGHSLEPSVYVTNLLDHPHLIKGAFFSGASFEERRNVLVKLSYHL